MGAGGADRASQVVVDAVPRRVGLSAEAVPAHELLPLLQLVHELRSPLAAVQGCLDMVLQGYTEGNPKLRDELVGNARDRAAAMLAQVDDFMRLGGVRYLAAKGELRPVQLLDVLRRLLPEMRVRARWRGVDLSLEAVEELPCIRATDADMEHLLSNVMANAIKYTGPGGRVVVHAWPGGADVVCAVEDTGMGIAAEDLPRIFDEFYRSERAKEVDAHGTGLGLSIVKRIVELYGGTLAVWSRPGQGSVFAFAFAATACRPAPAR